MIFGDCPYCGEHIALACPDRTPCWGKETCESCGRQFWEFYSRFDPKAFTMEEFDARFIVNEETKQITERHPEPPLDAIDEAILASYQERLLKLLEDEIINGHGVELPKGLLGKSPIE